MADGTDDTTVIDNPTEEQAGADDAEQNAADSATEAQEDAPTDAAGADENVTSADDTESVESDDDNSDDDSDSDNDDDDDDESDDDDDDDEEDSEDSENPLEVEGEVAADYLEELLDIADLDGDIDTYVENGRAHVSVITESDVLVGKDGEVLEALQELARLAVITETGSRSRLMLDVAGFREARRKELTQLAADAVEEAKTSGEAVRLKPMNPFERKIVHDAVAAAGLSSESEGEEPQRRVVVQPTP